MRSTLLLWLLLPVAAFGEFPLDAVCKTVKDVPYPAVDQPSAEDAKTMATCNSSDLFFGFKGPLDQVQGRKCAYLELRRLHQDIEKDYGRGYRLLALIYGNGLGVKQNYPLAEKFACHEEYFPPEDMDKADIAYLKQQVDYELKQLQAGEAKGAKEPLGLCSSFLQLDKNDWCQPFQVKAERSLAVHRAMDRMAPGDSKGRSELERLLKAEAVFSDAEQPEIAQDGDSAAIWMWRANNTIDQEFFSLLDSLASDKLPKASDAALSSDDQKLNDAYRNLKVWGTVTKAHVQGVERAWIAYRDAWTHFVQVAYPSRSPRDVSDVLTRHRTDMLGCLSDARPYQEFKNATPACGG